MRTYFILAIFALCAACTGSDPMARNSANSNEPGPGSNRPQTVTGHTTENQPPSAVNGAAKPSGPGRWSANGDPIDTTKFDGAISEAERAAKGKPNDAQLKKDLAQAYFERGVALTEARQYAAALGDYRKALKLDPAHEESKKWMDEIVRIYQMLKKDPPKEGEEPAPLPLKS
ncbi:MAG TPA: tetratricopeptide repeat protein [Pyrinomonadaceae bacterium]|nr:tetratricopeptide repeat protein [Pyrinomonadaceae bacterium]